MTGLQTIVSRQIDITAIPAVDHRRRDQGRHPLQHHSRRGGDDRHRAHVRARTCATTSSAACKRLRATSPKPAARRQRAVQGSVEAGSATRSPPPVINDAGSDAAAAAGVRATRRQGQRARDQPADHRGRLLVLRPAGAVAVLLGRHHARATATRRRPRSITRRCSISTRPA